MGDRRAQAGPALSLTDVVRNFGGVRAVDGVTFAVPQQSITGLIGPNGAGKSTAMNLIAGRAKPDSGRVVAFGRDVTGMAPHKLARRGVVRSAQLASEFGKLTVLENLVVAAPNQRGESLLGMALGKRYWWRQEEEVVASAREWLNMFGLAEKEKDYAANLSGGQKRLLEIARALMTRPNLLLLDEPLAGVHPALARRMLNLLGELRASGLTMLMAEHDLAAVGRTCNPVIVMAEGRVIASGPIEELRSRRDVRDAYLVG